MTLGCLLTGALVLASGCGSGELTVITPPPPPSGEVSLLVRALEEDAGVAGALGWSAGIPGATVVFTLTGGSGPPQTLVTDSTGRVTLELPAGRYEVVATRWLSAEERARAPVGEGVVGWPARASLQVQPGVGAEVRVAASRRRSLVVTKWFFGDRIDPKLNSGYPWGGYLGLYNNADTTIYLDGILIGRALGPWLDFPLFPCSLFNEFQNDPLGVWVLFSQKFPGTGREHPLAPGQEVLVATDAIDHGAVIVDGADLRGAGFEFTGTTDPDNPAVPNMVDTGPTPFALHGLMFDNVAGEVVIALPTDITRLPTTPVSGTSRVMARVPLPSILDVVTHRSFIPPGVAPCARAVTPLADRSENTVLLGIAEPTAFTLVLERRSVPEAIGGQVVFQHTRGSGEDFIALPRDPRAP